MKTPTGGQSGRTTGDDRSELPKRWLDVPPDVLWQFAVDKVAQQTLRGVARRTGLGVETVRKFILRIGEPNLSTRRRFAEMFLKMHAGGVMEEDEEIRRWKVRPRLLTLLPEGRFEARAALVQLFAVAKRHPDEVPLKLDDLHDWMDLQVRAEYNAQEYFDAVASGEREHDPESIFARKPPQKRKKRGAESGE
ncbi:MAG TPA: hypothetical protein VEX86_05175 [Longimicrobium sp.]|nr:hypothetical protein [Longimicrobium sp.]